MLRKLLHYLPKIILHDFPQKNPIVYYYNLDYSTQGNDNMTGPNGLRLNNICVGSYLNKMWGALNNSMKMQTQVKLEFNLLTF